jgi:SH3-like domain-containing protein
MGGREKGTVKTPSNRLGSRACGLGEGKRGRPLSLWGAGAGLLVVLVLIAWQAGGAWAGEAQPRRRTPSGLPVPRWVSLKFDEVNARAGPGDDYRLLWTYRVRGLPLQVIAETADWRRVCDPEGSVAWVHQRTVDTRRMVMRTKPQALPIRRRPEATSPAVALLSGRSLAALEDCKDGWCRLEAGRAKGWTPAPEIWGADDAVQCKPRLAARVP